MPSKKDISYLGEEGYRLAVEKCNFKNSKVLFKNVLLQWDSCECIKGYECLHGSYVYEIDIINKNKKHVIKYKNGNSLHFYNEMKYCQIPTEDATIFDFIRMCEICKIELELSDYALSLFN